MDLFTDSIKSPVPFLENWKHLFYHESLIKVNILLKNTHAMRNKVKIYPEHHDILNAFKDNRPKEVKVIILGQDPYHNGNATGHAFACKLNISPSLRKIVEQLKKEPKTLIDDKKNASLHYLVKQGVMLLNTILTVEEGKPLSHKELGWQSIVEEFLRNFSYQYKGVVYMLWGGYAKDFSKHINPVGNLILTYSHPAYASYQNIEWNCDHFKKANEFLTNINKLKINWY